jgi:hypothetical protein
LDADFDFSDFTRAPGGKIQEKLRPRARPRSGMAFAGYDLQGSYKITLFQ